jgi:hypothetical protein
MTIERWRAHGIERAFDPDAADEALAAAVENLDPAALARHYPRDVDGRLPLGESVLLLPLGRGRSSAESRRAITDVTLNESS